MAFGRYEVQEKLGQGSFAAVYRGWDPLLRRPVAIKMLLPGWVDDVEIRGRFTTESQILAGLRHPNIVTVHDVGEADGRPFFAMELVDGPTLDQLLTQEGRLPATRVSAILDELASAVDYLHGEQLIHRDIKLANVMLDSSGRVVLMDFNIARSLEATRLTSTGAYLGTPGASAPEQILGRPTGPAADVYALGVLAFQLLTGRPPFTGDLARITYAIVHEAPPPVDTLRPDLSPATAAAIHAALAKQPEARPAPARTFADAFAGRGPGRTAPPTGSPAAPAPPPAPTMTAYSWQPPAPVQQQLPAPAPHGYPAGPAGPFPGYYPPSGMVPMPGMPPPAPHMAGPWLPRPRPRPYRSPPGLWFGWVLATVLGGVAAALLIRGLDVAVDGPGGFTVADQPQLFVLRMLLAGTFGSLVGFGQALALPLRGGSRFLWWMATSASFALAYPAAFQWGDRVIEHLVELSGDPADAWVRFRIFFILGALIGGGVALLQSLLLWPAFRHWWAWPALSMAAMAVAFALAYTAGFDDMQGFIAEYDAGLIAAVAVTYAVLTGSALLVMVQRRDSP